jgi:peptidoglycan/LPS O-acetylase OafA/YrhL
MNIQQRIEKTSGRASGFDYTRLVLAVTVVLLHTVSISYGANADAVFWYGPLKPIYRLVVPMFFALSGYLVASSLERSKTIGVFLGLRVLRIYPGLAAEVLVSALILGPLLTTVPLHDYFKAPEFRHYLWTVTGDNHYNLLPGLFTKNPMTSAVNGQLWTLIYELLCYIVTAILALLGIFRLRAISIFSVVILTFGFIAVRFWKYGGHFPHSAGVFPGFFLVVVFLSGLTIYLYRDIVPWSGKIAGACGLVSVVLVGLIPYGEYASPLPIAYFTVYLGLINFRRIGIVKGTGLSYGIYLYGWAIQQTVTYLLPWSRQWYLNGLISLPLVLLVAAVSSHFIERPPLSLKSHLYRLETWYMSRRSRGLVLQK